MGFSSALAPAEGQCFLVISRPVTPWKSIWGSGIWGRSLPDWIGLWLWDLRTLTLRLDWTLALDWKACLWTHPTFTSAPIKQVKCRETLITHTKPWKCRKQKIWASGVTKLFSGLLTWGSLGVWGDRTTGGDGLVRPLFLSLLPQQRNSFRGERIPRAHRYLLEKGRALWRRFWTVADTVPEEDAGFYQ